MILLINVFSPSRLDLLWNKALSASVLSHTFYSLELFNPLMGTLKPQSNGPLCSHTVIGTLAVDGWAHGWYIEEGPGRAAAPPSPLLAVPNVTDHPSTASVPTSYYSMRLNNHVWAYCPHGRQRRCQEDPVSSPPPPADWRRQPGRPRITCLRTVQQDLKQHHLTLPEGWCRRIALRNLRAAWRRL